MDCAMCGLAIADGEATWIRGSVVCPQCASRARWVRIRTLGIFFAIQLGVVLLLVGLGIAVALAQRY